MNIQPGGYIALKGLTEQQIDDAIDMMEKSGGGVYNERDHLCNFLVLDHRYIICFFTDRPEASNNKTPFNELTIEQVLGVQPSSDKNSKYDVEINGTTLDVYDVLKAWNVTNPALQHLIKKALQAGNRGHKTLDQDMDDIVASAIRARELAK